MTRFKSALLAATVALTFARPAAAETPTTLFADLSPWMVYKNDGFCDGGSRFSWSSSPDVIDIRVTLNQYRHYVIMFTNKDWNIPNGTYKVEIGFDNYPLHTVDAKAVQNSVFLPFDAFSAADYNVLSNANSLTFKIGTQTRVISLAGSQRMMESLVKCVGTLQTTPTNPFGTAPTKSASNPFTGI
jgi:hypothetical protein